jgi:hypothetical protein
MLREADRTGRQAGGMCRRHQILGGKTAVLRRLRLWDVAQITTSNGAP